MKYPRDTVSIVAALKGRPKGKKADSRRFKVRGKKKKIKAPDEHEFTHPVQDYFPWRISSAKPKSICLLQYKKMLARGLLSVEVVTCIGSEEYRN